MATIHVDGKTLEVDGADNLLQACLSLGLDIPYFCWHPALGSVGACRQCAVKQYTDENDKRGRLVMSCMTPATDNTWISIEDEEAKQFRASVVEWLMTNHPHDCPVCEEGGHCHLQDMTVMTGHNERRYRFTKRTHQNQELGPFIAHEMNRCIACYRCVRYYKDYAGGTDLGVYGAHDNVYFGRVEDGVLESEFSGNLTEVCPTGVFTDKTHSERYNRKWDMQFAPSICHGCSSGCNISPGERYGEIRRIENRYNGSVNHYFLCDRGRFGYGYVNREDRPRQPLLVLSKQKLSLDGALDQAAALLKERKVVGIGSPRASLESNFALRELVGEGNFYSGINEGELDRLRLILQVMQEGPLPVPSIRDIEDHDAVFVLGEDLTQTAARIALALRQSVKGKAVEMAADMKVQPWLDAAVKNIAQHAQNPLFIASVSATRLDDVAEETVHAAPDDLARLGFAVAHAIDPSAPSVADLDPQAQAFAQRIADALLAAKRPLVVSGNSLGNKALIEAAANIAKALKQREKNGSISLVVGEANSLGLALFGGDSVEAALERLTSGQADAVVVLENDLYRRTDAARVDAALAAARVVIVADHQQTATTAKAHLVLPAASFAEERRHPGQPGRPRPALLPGVRPDLLRRQEHGPRGLALAACDPQHPARQARRLDPAGPRHRSRGRGQADPGRYPRRRTGRLVPHQGPQAGPRTAPLQRAHRHARQHQRARTAHPAGHRLGVRLLHGRLLRQPGRPSADPVRLVAGLELAAGLEQVPGRGRRPPARRRPRRAPDRTEGRRPRLVPGRAGAVQRQGRQLEGSAAVPPVR
ncbi:NADH dehydrogenase subunit G [Pseudomonas aeruginosa VRFPA08]|nr:NADH dehydrogenase subunit G [Pseudomonas aeruginosa VRFPA08]